MCQNPVGLVHRQPETFALKCLGRTTESSCLSDISLTWDPACIHGGKMRIYITGASCAGVTTLGHNLATRLGIRQVDVDDFYWMPTNPPFTTKRPPSDRASTR